MTLFLPGGHVGLLEGDGVIVDSAVTGAQFPRPHKDGEEVLLEVVQASVEALVEAPLDDVKSQRPVLAREAATLSLQTQRNWHTQ